MAEDVRAEIVASVLEVVVSEGDQIGEGDTLVLLESMKMEIPVLAEVAGTISKVSVAVGEDMEASIRASGSIQGNVFINDRVCIHATL